MKLAIGGLCLLICVILKPFLNIRFGNLYSSRIGHLCINIDNYLTIRKANSSKEVAIFNIEKRVANKAIYGFWKNDKNLYFSRLARFPLFFLEKYFQNSNMKISYETEMMPIFSYASLSESNFCEDDLKKIFSDYCFKKFKIHAPYICFHNRDSAYLTHYGCDGNQHDFRDFNFEDYEIAIKNLKPLSITAVRLGEKIDKEVYFEGANFISITEEKRNDFSDINLIANSIFFVGCNTGFSHLSRVLRKPSLLINFIPFCMNELSALPAHSLVLPKKIINIKENRYLRFSDIFALPYDIHHKGDFFGDLGLRVINNTPEEIADALLEMYLRITGKWRDSELHTHLQQNFWMSVENIKYSKLIRDHLGIRISSKFLERNHFLI